MTQWEQLKNEYREIPVPVNGQAQMLVAMEKARQKRSNRKKYVKYASLAAAAMLVLLLMPKNMFRMGSKSAAPESAARDNGGMMFDAVMEESAVEEGFWFTGTDTATGSAEMDMSQAETPMEEVPAEESIDATEDLMTSITQGAPTDRREFSAEELAAISLEISKQTGEGVIVDNSVEYYINEEELYVIVFEAGEIAPEEQGRLEFVIPAEVVSP